MIRRQKLTQRERQVIELIAVGLTDREIAVQLAISSRTVSTHVTGILTALNANNRAHAVYLHYCPKIHQMS